ncbi:MAG: HAMP domain-containing histidine kinase [Solobacterium sp.]|nr:HAMP domain-containing histidine kinase [Solobacterium sp.]
MRKRMYLWLRELSLSQQLLTIAFLVISIFTVFLFAFLSPQIDLFTRTEMYRMLHQSQASMSYYLTRYPDDIPEMKQSGAGIIHGIYEADTNEFIMIGEGTFTDAEKTDIRLRTAGSLVRQSDYELRTMSENGRRRQSVLYTLTPLDDGRYLISKMSASYETTFRRELVSNIVDINVIVAGVLFLLLMVWAATLIHPLNQIRNYVTRIKLDEPASLNVNRRDEIGQVADALRDMQEELQKHSREKQEMIQNISHDLKTPIATIRSYGESIKDGIYAYGTLEGSVDVIIEHADRLEKKVGSLLAMNRMDYLLDECAEGDHLDMAQVIDKVLLSLKVIRPEIEFHKELTPGVLFHGDEDPWRIVVENLVDNALRYAESEIRIELEPGELRVSNDGKQIPPDRMDKLFTAYEKGTDGKFGLGLTIVHKVCTTYGYHVEAENLEKGVCFRIWKELSRKELKAIAKEKKKEDRAQKSQR